jgi:IS30 family transposase
MSSYTQLTREQRYQISALKKAGHTQRDIAEHVGTDESTIRRELRRNRCATGYDPAVAHEKAVARRQQKAQCRITAEEWQLVEEKIRQDWSPEQVSERLKREHDIQISHEWIYQHIYADKRTGGDLHTHLRCQKPYRKRSGGQDRRGKIRNRVDIDERPEIVDRRARIGDWEADTVVGKGRQRYLVTLVERKSRFTLFKQVESKRAAVVREAIVELLAPYQDQTHTITFDNGKEFAEHEQVAEALETETYFAHPYASWERGTNENTNGLLRQYFPKDSNFSEATDARVAWVHERLNTRPRKCLDFETPATVFREAVESCT